MRTKAGGTMVWRESFPKANELSLDAEAERERRLAAQARAGADWALTALVARYQPAVIRYLTRLCGDQARARELAERVFQRMERRLHGPQGADNLRLWLLRASTEAGLEALRRPRRTQPPRLTSTPVAGLLPSESGGGAQAALRGGIKRLRHVVGEVSRQARPLIWQGEEAEPASTSSRLTAESARAALRPSQDSSQDDQDPREALRHRLIRLTLADLPYGDAQCLALHLVAGLNQAEVARALGLTNSATRKRIVQGLAQFSARYQAAVRSLGLPEDIGYGEAAPRRMEEAAAVFSPPEPAPVVVSQTASEAEADVEYVQGAPSTVPLSLETYDEEGERVSGVMYYTRTTGELPEMPAAARDLFASAEAPLIPPVPGYSDYPAYADLGEIDDAEDGAAYEVAPTAESATDGREQASAQGGRHAPGAVTRIAADAIVGPVVDALPVDSEAPPEEPGIAAPSSHSIPLAYELASGQSRDLSNITMNWIDSSGMLAPLSFEAMVTPGASDLEPSDDPWARSMVLDFEALREMDGPEHAGDLSGLDGSDQPSAHGATPVATYDAWERAPRVSSGQDEALGGDATARKAEDTGRAAPVTRTLEDLWDEAPEL